MSIVLPNQLAELREHKVWGIFERGDDPKYRPVRLPNRAKARHIQRRPTNMSFWPVQ